ncbi:NADH-ubiquinone oxidoreductase chain 1 [Golovinomyces cichoracearum]|uniref:NADH-ubiquinone oxidoreductase chain 1 n=1 Tax=Golovinomyces cichoracearum TaxID=62708 RepID=A0A420HHA4_9PEZI|nr:NADH-ubiquinone oxidoreductase chain 1 [Golovinomyces cichoracearum]
MSFKVLRNIDFVNQKKQRQYKNNKKPVIINYSNIGILLRVAFFTLMERKIIGLMHFRLGPNKVIQWGISQPIADALKLSAYGFLLTRWGSNSKYALLGGYRTVAQIISYEPKEGEPPSITQKEKEN